MAPAPSRQTRTSDPARNRSRRLTASLHLAKLRDDLESAADALAFRLSQDELIEQRNGERVLPVAVLVDQPGLAQRGEHLVDVTAAERLREHLTGPSDDLTVNSSLGP